MPVCSQRGYTLIELLIVIAIILVLVVVSVQGFIAYTRSTGPQAAARTVLGSLEEAHARTLASENDTEYGVHVETSSVTLFVGTTYTSGDASNDVRTLPHRTEISAYAISGGGDEIVFDRITGDALMTGTITVSRVGGSEARTITVHATGLSEISN